MRNTLKLQTCASDRENVQKLLHSKGISAFRDKTSESILLIDPADRETVEKELDAARWMGVARWIGETK